MLGSRRAQSSQPCPPRPSGVPSQEQRGRRAVPCQAVPGMARGSAVRRAREVLGQDAVCWVRVGLSCPPDHFLPYLGNLDFLLPFVPYFSLVKLSLVLLETAAGAGPGERAGGSGCFSAHAPAAELAPPEWHRRNDSRLCRALAAGGALGGAALFVLVFLRSRGGGRGRAEHPVSGWCWDLPCPAHRTQNGLHSHEHHTPALPASHSWSGRLPGFC